MIGALKDQLCALSRRWHVAFGNGAVTEGMKEASWEWGAKEERNGKNEMILGTGGDDCVELCASLFCVCGRYRARSQKSKRHK